MYVDRFTDSPAVQIEYPQQHIVIMFQIRKSCEYVFSGRYSVKRLHGVWVWPFSQSFYCMTRKLALQVYQWKFHVYVNHGPWGPYFQAVFYPEKGHNRSKFRFS